MEVKGIAIDDTAGKKQGAEDSTQPGQRLRIADSMKRSAIELVAASEIQTDKKRQLEGKRIEPKIYDRTSAKLSQSPQKRAGNNYKPCLTLLNQCHGKWRNRQENAVERKNIQKSEIVAKYQT